MDFGMTEEQELLLENLAELVSREWDENEYNDCYYNKHCQPERFIEVLRDAGFTLLGVPEEFGGTEVDLVTQIMVAEELSHLTGAYIGVFNAIAVDDMLTFGTPEQQEFVLGYITEHGTSPFSLGFTEPQAGSDSSAITTMATHRGDGTVVINGHKTMITDPDQAAFILTACRDDDNDDPKAMSMYLVDPNAPGVRIEPLHKIGLRTGSFCEIYYEDVEIPESNLVGVKGNGFMQLMKNYEIERLMLVAMGVGMAEAAFDDVCAYINVREQFGQPLARFQLIQEKITDMAIKIENMRNMLFKTAWLKQEGESVQIESALAKRYCAQASFEVLDEAMQIMGGIGYTQESRISRMWTDVRHLRIAGGTDEIMVHIAGRAIAKKHR